MAKVSSRLLVVDASLAQAAGDASAHPTSKHCRDFLLAVERICHKAIFTPSIRKEWDAHASSFSRKWRVRMNGRKKIAVEEASAMPALINTIDAHDCSAKQRASMTKDVHLIEASFAHAAPIVSLDDNARILFARLVGALPHLAKIEWVNPANPEEAGIAWLEAGAPSTTSRTLQCINRAGT